MRRWKAMKKGNRVRKESKKRHEEKGGKGEMEGGENGGQRRE